MSIFAILMNNKALVGIAVLLILLVAAGGYIKVTHDRLESCQTQKQTLTSQLEISNESVRSLQAAIDEQNTAVEKLKSDSEQRLKRNQKALQDALAAANINRKRAKDILNTPVPANLTDCEAAEFIIDKAIADAKK